MDMRVTNFTIFLLLFCLLPFLSFSQQKNFHSLIKISTDDIRLDSLSAKVFRQTRYIFSFNSIKISPNTKVSVSKKETTLNDLLYSISQQLKIHYATKDHYIILRRTTNNIKEKNTQNRSLVISKISSKRRKIDSTKKNNSAISSLKREGLITVLPEPNKNKYINQPIAIISFDSLEMHKKILSSMIPSTLLNKKENTFSLKKSKIIVSKENLSHINFSTKNILSPYISSGISADETMFLNANINAGFRLLFGTIDWSTNFKESTFLYGIGTSFPLWKNWFMQLSGLRGGRVSNNYQLDLYRNADSTRSNLLVKAFLSRINLTMKKQINSRIQLEFGPILNFMNTKYYLNDSLIAIRTSFPNNKNPDATYYGIRPPYTLINNFSSNSLVNKKMWIGFKIGLVYIFN